MATREVLTQTQREYFYKLSDQVSERERIRYYTLSEEDIQIIRQQRGATNQLGFAIPWAPIRFWRKNTRFPCIIACKKIRNRSCSYT